MKRLVILSLLAVIGIADMWAGANYYCDVDVKLSSPSSAQGVVYLNTTRKIIHQSRPAQNVELKSNLSCVSGDNYTCYFFAYPKAGYALDGFVTKADYVAGRTSQSNLLRDRNANKYKSGDWVPVAIKDTVRDSKTDPTTSSSYKFSAKHSPEFYAIFRPAKAQTVTCTVEGTLDVAVKRATYGEDVDDLTIKGRLNQTDLAYLKTLIKDHNLAKIDMSAAQLTEIPDEAFSSCSSLYEVKLPASGLVRIGNKAFLGCYSLKTCVIPDYVRLRGEDIFKSCWSMELGLN